MPYFGLHIPNNISEGEIVQATDLESVFGQIQDFHNLLRFDYENIKDRGLSGDRFQTGCVTGAKIDANTIPTAKINDGAITSDLIDSEAVNDYHINWGIKSGQLVKPDGIQYPFVLGRTKISVSFSNGESYKDVTIDDAFWTANALENGFTSPWYGISIVVTEIIATGLGLRTYALIYNKYNENVLRLFRWTTSGAATYDYMIDYIVYES